MLEISCGLRPVSGSQETISREVLCAKAYDPSETTRRAPLILVGDDIVRSS